MKKLLRRFFYLVVVFGWAFVVSKIAEKAVDWTFVIAFIGGAMLMNILAAIEAFWGFKEKATPKVVVKDVCNDLKKGDMCYGCDNYTGAIESEDGIKVVNCTAQMFCFDGSCNTSKEENKN